MTVRIGLPPGDQYPSRRCNAHLRYRDRLKAQWIEAATPIAGSMMRVADSGMQQWPGDPSLRPNIECSEQRWPLHLGAFVVPPRILTTRGRVGDSASRSMGAPLSGQKRARPVWLVLGGPRGHPLPGDRCHLHVLKFSGHAARAPLGGFDAGLRRRCGGHYDPAFISRLRGHRPGPRDPLIARARCHHHELAGWGGVGT